MRQSRRRALLPPRSLARTAALLLCAHTRARSLAQVITSGALIMELAAAFVLGATVLTYDYFSSRDSMGYF